MTPAQTGSQQPENIEFHISINNPKHPLLPYAGFVEAANVRRPEQHDTATTHCPRTLTPACQTPEQIRAEEYMSFQDDFHHPRFRVHGSRFRVVRSRVDRFRDFQTTLLILLSI